MTGKVFLIGAGPGDPGLLTMRAADLIARADFIAIDALVSDAIADRAPKSAEVVYVGKRASKHALPQDKINQLLIDEAKKGKIVVRLKGVLTVAEQQLVASLPAEKGRDLLKQVRIHLVETARPIMESMIRDVTGIRVVSLHHDISTVTGEELLLFTLAEPPFFRETKKR